MGQTGFLIEVLLLSAGLSLLIKYGGPALSVSETPAVVLTLVFVPTLAVALVLWWRVSHSDSAN